MKPMEGHVGCTRRRFAALLALAPLLTNAASASNEAGRTLDFVIEGGFGDAPTDNIKAVVRSAAETIWQHCPQTRWQVPGFEVFHSSDAPITLFDHRSDGRIAIGLTTRGTYWSQFAYQFAHEFCHALAGHSNDWRKTWIRERKANQWLEESLCETASLFALREMSKCWSVNPPYPNWKGYAASLQSYAEEHMKKVRAGLPRGFEFGRWFAENQTAMRANGTLRDLNAVVALQLLPLFEAKPKEWECVTYFNLTSDRRADQSLAECLQGWRRAAPIARQAFIGEISALFGVD